MDVGKTSHINMHGLAEQHLHLSSSLLCVPLCSSHTGEIPRRETTVALERLSTSHSERDGSDALNYSTRFLQAIPEQYLSRRKCPGDLASRLLIFTYGNPKKIEKKLETWKM